MSLELQSLGKWLARKYTLDLNLSFVAQGSDSGEVYWIYDQERVGDSAELLDRQLGIWIKFRSLSHDLSLSEVPKLVENDVQWGLRNAASLTRRTGVAEKDVDRNGGWQIHLIWLVHEKQYNAWCQAMHQLRSQSGYSEELGLDVIFVSDPTHFDSALDDHGLPQLLFGVRKLLRMGSTEIERWTSANPTFEKALSDLPNMLTNTVEAEMARQFVADVLVQHQNAFHIVSTEPVALRKPHSLTVTNFRNIEKAELNLSSANGSSVNVTVVHGPNGVGKSGLFEALCLGVASVSRGLEEYILDPDITASERMQYVSRVLKSFKSDSLPSISLDGANALDGLVRSADEARNARVNSDGTLLAQEDARRWVMESSSDLGSRILSGYSTLAQITRAYSEREFQKANLQRQEWLRKFGLSAHITKRETRFQKLTSYFISEYCPRAPQQVTEWLKAVYMRLPDARDEANALAARWSELDGFQQREDITARIANAERLGFGREILSGWLSERTDVLEGILALSHSQATFLQKIASNFSDIEQDVEAWHKWLIAQARSTQNLKSMSEALQEDEKAIGELSRQIFELTEHGRQLRMQFDHLSRTLQDPLPAWAEIHPNICPTCNAEHSEGILSVVRQLQLQLEEKINNLRKEYVEKQELLKRLRAQQVTLGKCPVSEERRRILAESLHFPQEGQESLGALLIDPQFMQQLLGSLKQLIAIPSLSDFIKLNAPADEVAVRIIGMISQEDARGEELWSLPERWSQLKKRVDEVALHIVRDHLPATLESVWRELVFFLTPARWNVAGEPRLKADLTRGDQKLRVVIQPKDNNNSVGGSGLLARHAFNQAEQHVLGLAWFFTRYLTYGRFQCSLIALDDPAQEMDQTTYRAFVRWLQVLTRLHTVRNIPLSLITFLHQEDRALDLARATSQRVMMLRWAMTMRTDGPESTVHHLILRNDEQKPPVPAVLRRGQIIASAM